MLIAGLLVQAEIDVGLAQCSADEKPGVLKGRGEQLAFHFQ